MDISIVIPFYNESENVTSLCEELTEVLNGLGKPYEILCVDDGSTDNTLEKLNLARENNNAIKIIELTRNFGQTPAIMAGFNNAQGDVIVAMDGDLQNDPHDIPRMIEKLNEGYDLVSGWRKKRKDNFLFRTLPSKIANKIIAAFLKTPIHDYGCTLKAYKRKVVENIRLYGEMHRFIPAIANWNGARLAEVEVNHRPRIHGYTKYGINRTIKVVLDLLLVAFLSEYSTKPIRFFGGLGIASSLFGMLSFLIVVFMKVLDGIDMTGNPLLVLSVLFFLVSIQLLSMGFLGEINIRTYYESQDKKTYHIRKIV